MLSAPHHAQHRTMLLETRLWFGPQKGAALRSVFSYTGQGRSQCQHLSKTGFLLRCVLFPLCATQANRPCAPHANCKTGKSGREINGFPVQQRPSCKAAEFNMQTPPPRPQTPSSWLSGHRQLEPHNVCALRLLGPSYYSLGFSITR